MNFTMQCDNGTICTGYRSFEKNCEEITCDKGPWEKYPCYYNPFRCRKHHVQGIILSILNNELLTNFEIYNLGDMCEHWVCKTKEHTNLVLEIVQVVGIFLLFIAVFTGLFIMRRFGSTRTVSVPVPNEEAITAPSGERADEELVQGGGDLNHATVTPRARYDRYNEHIELGLLNQHQSKV